MRHYASNPEWQIVTRTRAELDLRDQPATNAFFEAEKPDQVILAAATVGGIKASYTQPVDFLLNNLQIQNSVLSAAHRYDVKKLSRIWRGGPFHCRAGAGFPKLMRSVYKRRMDWRKKRDERRFASGLVPPLVHPIDAYGK